MSPLIALQTCCFVTLAAAAAIDAHQAITGNDSKSRWQTAGTFAVHGTESTSKRYSVGVNCSATSVDKRGISFHVGNRQAGAKRGLVVSRSQHLRLVPR